MAISRQKSIDMDFQFFKNITENDDRPDFSGYNTKIKRENRVLEALKEEK